ncbi:hypothetical protein [Amycolatopsis azurea]|uniref:Uncharacterized protein n=1 Tax=Amycolatopsis azurea DSM 43854 TaxID=1238180 RepID=M2PF13_9PSEU|nr:hypothetical protein [Amycolatopsis azurea]EMD22918.1 hypothetical protein C791_7918 [Amycolatopsis azurea DSM 43854]OOC04281.1 hypothetical protein B0293_23790 [Amycolatopsis azurea DSM 43854]
MSHFVLLNCRLFTGGADLTGSANKLELSAEVSDEERTNFGSGGWKEVIGGLRETELSGGGQWEAGDPGRVDDARWAELGGLGPWTACPDTASLGSLAYFTLAMSGKYKLGDQVGAVAPWEGDAKGSWPLVRGQIAHPPGTARTATGTGSGIQLGAVPAGKHLYAAAHILSIAGTGSPSITLGIESDADNTFASPSTVATFAAADALGGQIVRAPGPAADTWFRPKWTVTGTGPSFLFVVALGIA